MNHLARQIACEEPDITTASVRPGVVDTNMQRDLREVHSAIMSPEDTAKFQGLHQRGELLRPDQPGNVMARMALDPPKELSGSYLKYVLSYSSELFRLTLVVAGRAKSLPDFRIHDDRQHTCYCSRNFISDAFVSDMLDIK